MKYHFTLVRTVIIKKIYKENGREGIQTSHTVSRNELVQPLWRKV